MPLVEDDQVDTAVLKVLGQLEEVFQGAAGPVEFVMTIWSPVRFADSRALSSSGRRASVPDASSRKISSQPAAVSASCWLSGC